ncbi:MAG: hypothetical protein H0W48_00255 [Methylibium sp.]|nr:hypothetical protein [Methylibium sp.]
MSTTATPIRRRIFVFKHPCAMARQFDWCATFADHDIDEPQGYGPTRQAAIDDLIAKLGDSQ